MSGSSVNAIRRVRPSFPAPRRADQTGALSIRTVASARELSGSAISMTPAPAPKVVRGCVAPSTSISRRPIVASVAGMAAAITPSGFVRINRRPVATAQEGRTCASTCCGCSTAAAGLLSGRCRRSEARSAAASSERTSLARVCRRWSSTCTRAPTQMVARNAMIRTGTARRGAAQRSAGRRYAGLAMDCARPLMESGCADASAVSARAIVGLRWKFPCHPRDGRMCRIASQITCRLELIGADLLRSCEELKYLKKVTHE